MKTKTPAIRLAARRIARGHNKKSCPALEGGFFAFDIFDGGGGYWFSSTASIPAGYLAVPVTGKKLTAAAVKEMIKNGLTTGE